MYNNVEMKLVKRRQSDPIMGDISKLTESSSIDAKIVVANNILATSITRRVFNVDIVQSLNVSLYMLVDQVINNLNLKVMSTSGVNMSKILYQLIRNEMVRISLELQYTVNDHQINKVMDILSPDIDMCSVLLQQTV